MVKYTIQAKAQAAIVGENVPIICLKWQIVPGMLWPCIQLSTKALTSVFRESWASWQAWNLRTCKQHRIENHQNISAIPTTGSVSICELELDQVDYLRSSQAAKNCCTDFDWTLFSTFFVSTEKVFKSHLQVWSLSKISLTAESIWWWKFRVFVPSGAKLL